MLVLTRKRGESLIVDDRIEIKIVEIIGDKVKIGIEAPHDVKILRQELCQTVESNKQASGGIATKELLDFIARLDK